MTEGKQSLPAIRRHFYFLESPVLGWTSKEQVLAVIQATISPGPVEADKYDVQLALVRHETNKVRGKVIAALETSGAFSHIAEQAVMAHARQGYLQGNIPFRGGQMRMEQYYMSAGLIQLGAELTIARRLEKSVHEFLERGVNSDLLTSWIDQERADLLPVSTLPIGGVRLIDVFGSSEITDDFPYPAFVKLLINPHVLNVEWTDKDNLQHYPELAGNAKGYVTNIIGAFDELSSSAFEKIARQKIKGNQTPQSRAAERVIGMFQRFKAIRNRYKDMIYGDNITDKSHSILDAMYDATKDDDDSVGFALRAVGALDDGFIIDAYRIAAARSHVHPMYKRLKDVTYNHSIQAEGVDNIISSTDSLALIRETNPQHIDPDDNTIFQRIEDIMTRMPPEIKRMLRRDPKSVSGLTINNWLGFKKPDVVGIGLPIHTNRIEIYLRYAEEDTHRTFKFSVSYRDDSGGERAFDWDLLDSPDVAGDSELGQVKKACMILAYALLAKVATAEVAETKRDHQTSRGNALRVSSKEPKQHLRNQNKRNNPRMTRAQRIEKQGVGNKAKESGSGVHDESETGSARFMMIRHDIDIESVIPNQKLKNMAPQIIEAIEKYNATGQGLEKCKHILDGTNRLFRLRVGNYRLLCKVVEIEGVQILEPFVFRHRKNIYQSK